MRPLFLLWLLPVIHMADATVLIVGAGAAGLAAATKLLRNGVDVVVAEAGERLGGRIHSVPFGDTTVDLGAEWCHGSEGNVVHEIVSATEGVLVEDGFAKRLLMSDGEEVEEEFVEELFGVYEGLYEEVNELPKEGMTLGDYFHKNYDAKISDLYRSDPIKQNVARMARETFDRFVTSTEGAPNISDPSAEMDYVECVGNLFIGWNGKGFATFIDFLTGKATKSSQELLIKQRVVFNKEVVKIIWKASEDANRKENGNDEVNGRDSGNGYFCRCENKKEYKNRLDDESENMQFNHNSNENKIRVVFGDESTVNVNFVVFTPSLGVLKKKHKEIFEPSLPETKVEIIEELGFGGVIKFAMEFEESWWNAKHFTSVGLVWKEEDKRRITEQLSDGPKENGFSWVTDIFAFLQPKWSSNVVIGWIAGSLLEEIERLPEEQFRKGVTLVLEFFYGSKFNVTNPKTIIRSDWNKNPNFLGCYSYQTLKSRQKKVSPEKILAEPLCNGRPVVFFAGEATHCKYYSTVHGAVESGFRAAQQILEEIKATSNN